MSGKRRRNIHIGDEVWIYQVGTTYIPIWSLIELKKFGLSFLKINTSIALYKGIDYLPIIK